MPNSGCVCKKFRARRVCTILCYERCRVSMRVSLLLSARATMCWWSRKTCVVCESEFACACVYACVKERERVCECVWVRERDSKRDRERKCVCVCVCVCVHVCVFPRGYRSCPPCAGNNMLVVTYDLCCVCERERVNQRECVCVCACVQILS